MKTTPPKCTQPDQEPKKITLQDCLACSGCIDLSDITQHKLQKDIDYIFAISPLVKLNLFDHFSILKKRDYRSFEENLMHFIDGRNHSLVDTSEFHKFRLQKILGNLLRNKKKKKVIIGTYCPGVVSYIEKTYTNLFEYLEEVKTPEQLAFEYILKNPDPNPNSKNKREIIFIQSCFDKQVENKEMKCLTAHQFVGYLTELGFDPLKFYISDNIYNINNNNNESLDYFYKSSIKSFSSIDYFKTQIDEQFSEKNIEKYKISYKSENYSFLHVSGHENILNTLKSLDSTIKKGGDQEWDYIDLWVCEGGCSNGPGNLKVDSQNNFVIESDGSINLSNGLSDKFSELEFERSFSKFKMKTYTFDVEW